MCFSFSAPDPPRNMRISDLTNTSMVVSWDPPQNMNGVLRGYIVRYSPGGNTARETDKLSVS